MIFVISMPDGALIQLAVLINNPISPDIFYKTLTNFSVIVALYTVYTG